MRVLHSYKYAHDTPTRMAQLITFAYYVESNPTTPLDMILTAMQIRDLYARYAPYEDYFHGTESRVVNPQYLAHSIKAPITRLYNKCWRKGYL